MNEHNKPVRYRSQFWRQIFSALLGSFLAIVNTLTAAQITDANPMRMPAVGDYGIRLLSPSLIELTGITTKGSEDWNFAPNNSFNSSAISDLVVKVDGRQVSVQSGSFKRRPIYAPLNTWDMRVGNYLYLNLGSSVPDGSSIEVTNPNGKYWPADRKVTMKADRFRLSPVIHVNQEGYMPKYAKKAMVGYYLGSGGEMEVDALVGFKLINVANGSTVFSGKLTPRKDVGYTYSPAPYQKVLEADFTAFNQPGEYRLLVPGLGASYSFMITPGVAALYARTYALGLYHQRCGCANTLPFSRFIKGACHVEKASVPDMSYGAVNRELANMTGDYAAVQSGAPQLKDVNSSLYPFVNKGPINVKGGHHDAGDYSKYTINVAQLLHSLMFAVDAFPGVAALDNLGIPESSDGKSDILQEAKWEADFLGRLQDDDGGFYFLVYPRDREYEQDLSLVAPELGDPQVVFPKTTAVTAAAVGALAEAGSSRVMKKFYPEAAAEYLRKAEKGWNFLQNAIAKHGRDGSFQKITHYGIAFGHNDELAWAAAAMYAATGNKSYQTDLMTHFDPSDPNTLHWAWWHMFESYGCAIRTYAFAARTGRLRTNQLDAAYLAKCEEQILAAGDDQVRWAKENAYANSFPEPNKPYRTAGWFFSVEQTFDIATAYQIKPRQEYLDAMVGNMNYEGGCNPVNMTFLTGIGWKRQRETVNQYAENDRRVLPPTGIPQGSVQTGFPWLYNYGSDLNAFTFPGDYDGAPYPPYDRWADTFNTMTEFVNPQQGRSLASMAFLMARSQYRTQIWKNGSVRITGLKASVPAQQKITLGLSAPSLDMSNASYVWEGRDQEPTPGAQFTFVPTSVGPQWVEVEATLPDGRRVFANANFNASAPVNVAPNSFLSAPLAPSKDMVALYHLDTNWNSALPKGAKLTVSGNAKLDKSNVSWRKNRAGASLRTTDIGDQVTASIPNSEIFSSETQSISVEAMVYLSSFKGYNRGNAAIVSLQQEWNASLELYENIYEGPQFRGGTQLKAIGKPVTDALTRDKWHHLSMSIDKVGYTVKVDGKVVLTQPSNDLPSWGRTSGNTTLTLGNFDGWIDEVVVRSNP